MMSVRKSAAVAATLVLHAVMLAVFASSVLQTKLPPPELRLVMIDLKPPPPPPPKPKP